MALVDRSIEVRLEPLFAAIVRRRWWIVAFYLVALPAAARLALDIPRDNSIERMVVASDPDVAASREFEAVFPERDTVLLVLETADPFGAAALAELERVETELGAVDGLGAYSLATVWRRARPGAGSPADDPDGVRGVVAGTEFFRRQGLVGDGFLSVVLALDAPDAATRDRLLAEIERVAGGISGHGGAVTNVRRVGRPWVEAWLERETSVESQTYFPLLGGFVVALVLGLYRSWRALAAILLSLAAAVLLGMAFAGAVGLGFTIVSALVPLTLMVTATASLVYLHSRFVDQPDGLDLESHRARALANKLVAVTASVFAAAVGFAALTVSEIRPIRDLGLWTAGGLLLGWVVCFTLYPALQTIFRAPTRRERRVAGTWVVRAAEVLPRWSFRWRWPLVVAASALAVAGLAALLGVPGLLPGMELETDALAYIDPDEPVARDTRYFEETVLGLQSAKIWITTPELGVVDPGVLGALDRLTVALEGQPAVGSVVGLPSILRLRRHLAGLDEALPSDRPALERVAAELEQLLLTEPSLAQWVDLGSLASTYLTVTTAAGSEHRMSDLTAAVESAWAEVAAADPGLASCTYRLTGSGVLQATIAGHLVPTLVESFAITFTIIFVTFVLVFRSGPARLNAMVPSLFAILVTFLVMRLTGIPLNIATILIATTVLGVTENDQIHFFYHFLERRNGGSTEAALGHAIRVAGHAILFATVINAGGFLALALSDLPPMRQFGIVTALAFALAMLADFTALPAALWILFRERPTAGSPPQGDDAGPGSGDGGPGLRGPLQ
ncbi:MAG: MMPL family transporter [Thermoanaerobaculales bacterium]|nr:MMPL family transporter [Thermoanaerobaculales bacterium]